MGSQSSLRPGVRARINRDLTILGNFTLAANATTAVNGTLTFDSAAFYTVSTSPSSEVPFSTLGLVRFAGQLILEIFLGGSAQQQRRQWSLREIQEATVVVPVANYTAAEGSFSSTAIDVVNSDPCSQVVGTTTQQSGSSLTAVVSVQTDTSVSGCETSSGGGLSTGAIVGIAVGGAVVFILLVTILIICCRKRELAKQNALFMSNAYEKDLNRMSSMNKPE